jgi:predicted membrane protein (TIGR00267 family)
MMAEEHGLQDVDMRASLRSAGVVGGSSVVASVVPVLPFAFVSGGAAIAAATALALVLLLALGAMKARLTIGSPVAEAAKLAAIGGASALIAWLIAEALH